MGEDYGWNEGWEMYKGPKRSQALVDHGWK
jgi:hypothetical protein